MQTAEASAQKKKGLYYGWYIVIAAFIGTSLHGGVYLYGFSAFFLPLVNEFRVSRAALSGAFSLSRLEGGTLAPLTGFLLDRIGPRKVMLFGIIWMGLGFIIMSRVNSLSMFYLVFLGFLSIGAGFSMGSVMYAVVGNWFIRKRSRAFGIFNSGWGPGGMAAAWLGWLITQYGWRTTMVIVGILIWCVGIPVASVMRHKPEQYGLLPDGEAPTPAAADGETASKAPLEYNFGVWEAVRTKAFWLMTIAFSMGFIVTDAVAVHQVPFLVGLGYSPEVAGAVVGAMTMITIVGRLGFGWLGDIVDKRYLLAGCFILQCIGMVVYAGTTHIWQIVFFLVVFSPAYGGLRPLAASVRGEFFGRKNFATIQGVMAFVQMWGTIASPVFTGWIFDTTGSYRIAFTTFALANLLAVVAILLAKRPIPKSEVAHREPQPVS